MTRQRTWIAAAGVGLLACALTAGVPNGVPVGDVGQGQGSAAIVIASPGSQRTDTDAAGGVASTASGKPLQGKLIVLDPGHQLGNARHSDKVNRLVDAGGFRKACNTSGTATNGGFPEATFAWRVSRVLKRQLESHGATVRLTRRTNSVADWGPCINVRGRTGNRLGADAVISIHGDGASSDVRGFFVIRPGFRRGWTGDILKQSRRLSVRVKHGLVTSGARVSTSYGGDGYDVRTDLGTLNWSDVPIVMVELGNMRNRVDARHMRSPRYRAHIYADGLRRGVTSFVLR